MEVLRKYGEAATFLFPLVDRGTQDFESTPVTFASGDTQVSKNEGAFANTTNDPAHEGNGIYSLALTATEMEAARLSITVIDQTSPKAWEDQAIIISTYGNASGQHAFDLDNAMSENDIADALLVRDVDQTEGSAPVHSLTGAVLKQVSRVDASDGSNVRTYKTDGSTEFMSQSIADSEASPDIITEVGAAS